MDLIKGGKVTPTSPLLMREKVFDIFTQFIWAFRFLVLPVLRTGRFSVLVQFVSTVVDILDNYVHAKMCHFRHFWGIWLVVFTWRFSL